jgi:flagellar biosynthetic protein FliP
MTTRKALILLGVLALVLIASGAQAQTLPKISLEVGKSTEPQELSTTLQLVIVLTVLALAPSIQMPPNQLLLGLGLVLTFFIMAPVANKSYNEGIKPYIEKKITGEEAYEKAINPFREFMLAQTREQDLALFVNIAGLEQPKNASDVPLQVLVPGFVISELRTSFQIAFVIFVPFLVIDMVVASVLMSMGMMMLPPVIVSLPFKILLFVLVDGWYLLVKSLVESFHM